MLVAIVSDEELWRAPREPHRLDVIEAKLFGLLGGEQTSRDDNHAVRRKRRDGGFDRLSKQKGLLKTVLDLPAYNDEQIVRRWLNADCRFDFIIGVKHQVDAGIEIKATIEKDAYKYFKLSLLVDDATQLDKFTIELEHVAGRSDLFFSFGRWIEGNDLALDLCDILVRVAIPRLKTNLGREPHAADLLLSHTRIAG